MNDENTNQETEESQAGEPSTTVQTGQNSPPRSEPYIEVTEGPDEKWHWILWAKNGKSLATNTYGYRTRGDAVAGASATAKTFATGLVKIVCTS